jgi:ABC-type nickel/cobalt efflux system permease component RcnA
MKRGSTAMRRWLRNMAAAAPLAAAILLVAALCGAAFAQGPFGTGAPGVSAPSAGMGGVVGWLMAQQAIYYREFAGLIRAAKADGSAVYALLGVSFTYGVLHAAGPGHGKAVIASYLIANRETWRRGVVLSFASALLQALAALAIVGIAAVALGGTAALMGQVVRVVEIASYLLVIGLGLRLTWSKGHAFFALMRAARKRPAMHDCDHSHDHGRPAHDHHGCAAAHTHHEAPAELHGHSARHQADACAECGHAHGPEPRDLAGPDGWWRGLSAIVAVGLRPCSGAILVLVFALAQGLFWTGVASAFAMGFGTAMTVAALATLAVGARSVATRLIEVRQGTGLRALRGIELCAALAVLAAGLLLLTGYMANERMFGV